MALDETDKSVEKTNESASKGAESTAVKEANAGKADLVERQKSSMEYLKAGGTSGVTDQFDKPTFYDSKAAVAATTARVADTAADKTGDTSSGKSGDKSSDTSADKSADKSGDMGRVGDRSKDSGLGSTDKPDVTKDDQGRVTQYKLPDGTRYDIEYGPTGDPSKVKITPEEGQPMTFEKNKKGDWRDVNDPNKGLEYASAGKDGSVTIRIANEETTLGPDGSYKEKNWKSEQPISQIDADGTKHRFDGNNETIYKPGSHIGETKPIGGGDTKGYELRDDQNHVTKVDVNADGTATVTRGDKKETYDKVEKDGNGDLKLSKKDHSTLEIKEDGTQIHRDGKGHIADITNSDGEKTEFKHGANGKVTEATVTDAQGKVVEKVNKGLDLDEKTGTYTVEKDKDHKVERSPDGTERTLDKDGKVVETDADKLVGKFKNYTPEQQRQLRQDLADIDKLPEDQRKKVYESLNRIARNDEHPDAPIHLTGQQARELVASTAHQIAHPESIKQGDKMTCALANSEQTLAKDHPEVYADMVSKLATEGKYTTAGGKTIEAQHNGDQLAGKSDAYSQRSYASELFQNGAAQLGMKDGDTYKSYPSGSPELNPRPAGVTASGDTGERVVHKDGTTEKFNGFDAQTQADVLNQLAPGDKYKATEPIKSPAELEKAVKENGGTPLNVGIHLGPESSFTGMSGSSGASGSGYHAVNITRIETGKDGKKYVYYENPAGGADHSYPNGTGVPIDDFVQAMQGGNTKMRAVVKDKKH